MSMVCGAADFSDLLIGRQPVRPPLAVATSFEDHGGSGAGQEIAKDNEEETAIVGRPNRMIESVKRRAHDYSYCLLCLQSS